MKSSQRLLAAVSVGAGLFAMSAPVFGQGPIVRIGFETTTLPTVAAPATVPVFFGYPAITWGAFGDAGVGTDSGGTAPVNNFGLAATELNRFAVLTTFSDGGGTYAPGAPLFGGTGAANGAAAVWSLLFGTAAQPAGFTSLNPVSGSGARFVVNMLVGQEFRIDWRYLTSEPVSGGNNDFAFVGVQVGSGAVSFTQIANATTGQLVPATSALVDAPPSVTSFDRMMSSWSTFSFTAVTAGVHTFGIGVVDVFSEGTQSALLLDRKIYVPEPSTYAALAGALALGFAVWIRRRRA